MISNFTLVTTADELAEYLKTTTDELWKVGVDLYDYEYFIVIETKDKVNKFIKNFDPSDDTWNRLLQDNYCSKEWVHVEIGKKRYYVGAVYHS
jgi:hypothetical protein